MTTGGFSLAATIILMLPMMYFLLRPLSDPTATWMWRRVVSTCFALVAGTAMLAAIAFGLAGRPVSALGAASVAALSLVVRLRFLGRLDAELHARDAGDALALRRLRLLHWGGMSFAAAELIVVLASIPGVFPEGG